MPRVAAHFYRWDALRQRFTHHYCSGTAPSKCVRTAHTPKHFVPKGQNISPTQSAYFTAAKRRFHTAACRRISLSARAKPKHERRAAKKPRFALRKATVMRTKILSVTPLNPLGVTAPLMNKGSQEAHSVRLAEDREPRTRSICLCGTAPSKCVRTAHTPKHFAPKGQNISHAQSAYFTAAKRRFHTAACRRISLQSGHSPLCLCRYRFIDGTHSGSASLTITAAAPPLQNMCARRTHLNILPTKGQNISPTPQACFIRRSRVSYGEAALHTPQACFMWQSRASYAAGVLHVAKPRFIRRSRAYAATACSAAARFDVNTPSFIATALMEALPPAKPARSTVALPPTAFTAEEE